MFARNEDDVAAPTSVAATRTTPRNEFLAAKRKTSVAAVAGFDLNLNFVDEHGDGREILKPKTTDAKEG
jgi:hypothetical protein